MAVLPERLTVPGVSAASANAGGSRRQRFFAGKGENGGEGAGLVSHSVFSGKGQDRSGEKVWQVPVFRGHAVCPCFFPIVPSVSCLANRPESRSVFLGRFWQNEAEKGVACLACMGLFSALDVRGKQASRQRRQRLGETARSVPRHDPMPACSRDKRLRIAWLTVFHAGFPACRKCPACFVGRIQADPMLFFP